VVSVSATAAARPGAAAPFPAEASEATQNIATVVAMLASTPARGGIRLIGTIRLGFLSGGGAW
jgi:hypothetical protein